MRLPIEAEFKCFVTIRIAKIVASLAWSQDAAETIIASTIHFVGGRASHLSSKRP